MTQVPGIVKIVPIMGIKQSGSLALDQGAINEHIVLVKYNQAETETNHYPHMGSNNWCT